MSPWFVVMRLPYLVVPLEAIVRLAMRSFVAWSARRAALADGQAFALLDGATLRDLGVDRSEAASYAHEADGAIERTRRRLAFRIRSPLTRRWAPGIRTTLPEC